MKTIGVAGFRKSRERERLFSALGDVFGARFEECGENSNSHPDAWLINGQGDFSIGPTVDQERPSYVVINGDQRDNNRESVAVNFENHPLVPAVLRGRLVRSGTVAGQRTLPAPFREATALASRDGNPIWAVKHSPGGSNHYYSSLGIPDLAEHEPLYEQFDSSNFIILLPLFLFLREVTGDGRWEAPQLQACFMFDDPNLHWPTYGHIDFAKLALHAGAHHYHVAFATIPLDAWFVHQRTADIFRSNQETMSLLMHGNDHVHEELARKLSCEDESRTLIQALDRIEAVERKGRVEVSHVMAPPHGACSEEYLKLMAALGYEAACISKGSLRHYNFGASWVRTVGMRSCEIIGGLPVFMRFRISATCENSILLAALLNQPIIPVGHHHDVADGLDMFADLANFINSLGEVQWANMAGIARSHYSRRMDGRTLRVRMHTRKVRLRIPDGVSEVCVESSCLEPEPLYLVSAIDARTESRLVRVRVGESVVVQPGQKIDIALQETVSLSHEKRSRLNRSMPWASIRRLLTESRDRLQPAFRGVRTRLSARVQKLLYSGE